MHDIIASVFIFFVLALYAGISLVFVVAGVRKWIWRPIAKEISAGHADESYQRIEPTSEESSPS